MPLLDDIRSDIQRDEGCVLHAYEDSRGFVTIGYGRLIDPRRGGGITLREAEMLLDHDIAKVMLALDSKLPWWRELSEMRQRALINMAFNLGINGLLTFRRMLAALKECRYEDAAREAMDSRWAQQVGRRARVVADQLRYG